MDGETVKPEGAGNPQELAPDECIAAAAEVAGMLQPHVEKLKAAAAGGPKEKHNDA